MLDPSAVGREGDVRYTSWTQKDALLYAVGIGAGRTELSFATENSIGVAQQVYPTFAVAAGRSNLSPGRSAIDHIGDYDPAKLMVVSQAVTLHRPIPVAAEVTWQDRVVAMFDKGNAAIVTYEIDTKTMEGQHLWTLRGSLFIRGAGGWGGDRGPSGAEHEPPAGQAPDHELTLQTHPDQAFVYRLSGDRNPLHTDPVFAARAGFPQPILHGLCTYGFAGRALLAQLCDNDVTRFQHLEGRFASPVVAGEPLTVRSWRTSCGEAVFTTSVGERVAISAGLVKFSE